MGALLSASSGLDGLDGEGQALDRFDFDFLTLYNVRPRDGVPDFAVNEDFAPRVESAACDASFMDETLAAG
jgi:hypothetical protein